MAAIRRAVRVLLLDDDDRVLLNRTIQPSTGCARVAHFEPTRDGMTAEELEDMRDWRWWTVAELHATDANLVPRDLAARLQDLLADGPPPAPVDVGP